ncbi:MAG: 2-oxo acid dehydrogenase subunit E2 [Eubacteriales bacterium]|nr:2-oxo acid dehydrogenase subunit E2 [Eubacteriales bacterium]
MPRKDAELIKNVDSSKKFYTFLMPKRTSSACWIQLTADARGLNDFINGKKAGGERCTVFQIVIAALIRTASRYPHLNRFIYGHKIYRRKEYSISFAVSHNETTIFRKIRLDPGATFPEVRDQVNTIVETARKEPHDSLDNSMNTLMKLPVFLTSFILRMYPVMADKGLFPQKYVDEDVLYASAVVSNLGTYGISAPYHHLYDWGSASVFLTIGAIENKPFAMDDGSVRAIPAITFGFTVDERICDGKELADALNYFRENIENPGALMSPPAEIMK